MIVGDCWYFLNRKEEILFSTNNHPQSPGQKLLCFYKRRALGAGDCPVPRSPCRNPLRFSNGKIVGSAHVVGAIAKIVILPEARMLAANIS